MVIEFEDLNDSNDFMEEYMDNLLEYIIMVHKVPAKSRSTKEKEF